MLRSVRLRNFQAHEDSKIVFDPGDTVIIGFTDVGKTAVIRALEWVRTNRPLGKSFVRNGTDSCQVDIELERDGSILTVSRIRSRSENCYKIVNHRLADGQTTEQTFSAMGSDVPEDVTRLLGLADINVQTQLEQHFLVLDSPGEIARRINEVTHLEDADAVISWLLSQKRATDQELGVVTSELVELQAKLASPVFTVLNDFELVMNEYTDEINVW